VATGISGFAHLPTRKMNEVDIQFAKEHNIFFITTLTVTEAFARTRLNDIGFLKEPYIADTTPPWFLTELREFANKPQTEPEKKEWGGLQDGRRGRLLMIAGKPAERISDTRKIETVIQDGKIVDRTELKYDTKTDAGYRAVPGLFNP